MEDEADSPGKKPLLIGNEETSKNIVEKPLKPLPEFELQDASEEENIEFEMKKRKALKSGVSVEYGEFTLEVGLHRNKTIKVLYGIPLDKDGNPGENADNIIFYAPFLMEHMKNGVLKENARFFSEAEGYSVFSFDLRSDRTELYDRDKIYYYQESGFHDVVFRAQKIITEKFKLKKKKLIVLGLSGGGAMAEQLGVHHDDKIDAVVFVSARHFDLPKKDNKVAWLSMHSCGDTYGLKEQWDLQKYMRLSGMQMLHGELPPKWGKKTTAGFHHVPTTAHKTLLRLFVTGVIELRKRNGGKVPDFKQWPASSRYDGKQWYYPSDEFAEEWNKYSHEEVLELSRDKKHLDKSIFFIPKSREPKAIVVYIHDPACDRNLILADNLYYLMLEKNVIACSVRMSDNYFKSLKNIENLMDEVIAKKEWKDLPIYVCGLGNGGQLAAVAAFKKGETFEQKSITKHFKGGEITRKVRVRHARVRKITTINSPFDWPFPELSLGRTAWKRKSQIPLNMIFSSNYQGVIPGNSKYREVKRIDVDDFSLGKKWFETLSDIADGK